MIAIDYECFYSREYSLKKMTAHQYVRDGRFDPFLVSIAGEGLSFAGPPAQAPWERVAGRDWCAHNAAFDSLVHERSIELGIVPGWARPASWSCTADLAAYRQAPRSLEAAARVRLGRGLEKGVRSDMKGRRFASLSEEEKAIWKRYALADAEACRDLWIQESPHWPAWEQRLSAQTRRLGARGVAIDEEALEHGIHALNRVQWEATRQIPWAGSEAKTLSPKALAETCRAYGIDVPASTAEGDPACEAWEEKYGEKYPWVAAMRTYRKANKARCVLETIRERTREDAVMPFALKYCGAAATARWSGDAGLNLQNLARGDTFGVKIREVFVPRPGRKFVIADLCQIEPIVLAWLVGDETFLGHIRAGRDPYEAHARAAMGYTDPRPLREADPHLRLQAKARILGLSYGASHEPFIRIAKTLAGLELDPYEARRDVQAFRRSNPRIIALWQRLDRLFKSSRNETFSIELPSGREIRYFGVSPRGWNAAITEGDSPRRFWGSKLAENLVQGTARDVFADCLLRLEEAGFELIWHVHDEVIVEVDEGDRNAAGEIVRLMSEAPAWAPGLPVSAEAKEAPHYTK